MKLARMLTGWSGDYFENVNDVVELSNADYDSLLASEQAEPVCTLNPTVAAASLAEAATRLHVELTVEDKELADYLKTYGAVVHLRKPKK